MGYDSRTFSLRSVLALSFLLFAAPAALAQTGAPVEGTCKVSPTPNPKAEAPAADATSGIRLTVKGTDGAPLERKRFFLIERSARAGLDLASAPKRADFLQGASPQLREWLAKHDCDSLYCPEYEADYAAAVKTVPEFKRAYEEGVRKYRNEKLALRWVTVNFPLKSARSEYYRKKNAWLEQAARKAGKLSSAMTDDKGVAYFTSVKPGSYYVSNLLPLEEGGVLWDCQVTALPLQQRQFFAVTVDMSAPKNQAASAPQPPGR